MNPEKIRKKLYRRQQTSKRKFFYKQTYATVSNVIERQLLSKNYSYVGSALTFWVQKSHMCSYKFLRNMLGWHTDTWDKHVTTRTAPLAIVNVKARGREQTCCRGGWIKAASRQKRPKLRQMTKERKSSRSLVCTLSELLCGVRDVHTPVENEHAFALSRVRIPSLIFRWIRSAVARYAATDARVASELYKLNFS